MSNQQHRGSDFLRKTVPPAQARRIRIMVIAFPILVVTGYTILDRMLNDDKSRNPSSVRQSPTSPSTHVQSRPNPEFEK
ncbi:hypothetical protein R3P38DRAFT_2848794 [Favolaschia claudopus]|uniref:Uncharacterized protein n=1 Tax=Favolaschia claudopus TaxID=2862362 RepID=A0AAW0DW86_9AGAR